LNATIDLPTSTLSQILSNAFTRTEHPTLGSEFAGPTPFEIPENAVLEFGGPNRVAITFTYSDREVAEPADRLASADGTVIARLAEQTKKILRLQYSGDIEQHLNEHFAFDKDAVVSASGPHTVFSSRALRSFQRNTSIIESLLNALPEDIYRELHKQLRLLSDASGNLMQHAG
jgi:hypothetical protein